MLANISITSAKKFMHFMKNNIAWYICISLYNDMHKFNFYIKK
ncbi:hypothetical protein BMW23_0740 [Bodo saltans virus]|uniref:Uncharacterized protein n=1 Tax=Bodo saltans virus TaxID=2024608 RepID=A0A2H4UVA5_9VIRU|nr:hypothetical protein QJ851_gp0723 [Bodo saltans virus]ATZ80786.1 hypothetical protein BMW23_0740 [Bodo saltans virus]